MRSPRKDLLLRVSVWVVVCWLLLPLAFVGLPGTSPPIEGETASPPLNWSAFAASVAVAAAAAVLAVAIGTAAALLLGLTDFPARPLWGTLLLFPFLAPSTVWGLAHLYCYGPGGVLDRWWGEAWRAPFGEMFRGGYLGTTLVLAEIQAPLAMLIVIRGVHRLSSVGLDAARLNASRWGIARWLCGALRLELASSLLLAFALSLGNLAVPIVLQCPLFTTEIYLRSANYLDRIGALVASLPLTALAVAAAMCVALLDRQTDYSASQSGSTAPWKLGSTRWLIVPLLLGYLLLTAGLPLAALMHEAGSLELFLQVARDARPETENTLAIALGATLLAGMAGAMVGAWSARGSRLVDAAVMIPLGTPALVLALAYSRFYNRTWPVDLAWLGDGSLLVSLGLAARCWPFASRMMAAGCRRQSPDWNESAEIAGLHLFQRWRHITWPLMADYAAAAGVICFALSAGDVELSQVLCAPGSGTLALHLLAVLHFDPHVAASLALLQLAVTAAPVLVYFLVCNRWPQVV